MFNPFDLRAATVPAIVCVLSASTASLAFAQEESQLKVGSPAPSVKVEWANGKVESIADPSKTYVVEFWATWCQPCLKSIPHLNELHKKYRNKGLVIIGVSDEPMSKVKPFVRARGESMAYNVGADSPEKETTKAWREAAKQDGIPCAFVVRDSKIVWIGHPLDPGFDRAVIGTLNGRYNPALEKQAAPALEAAKNAIKVKNFKDAWRLYDDVIKVDERTFGDVAVRKYRAMLLDAKDPAGASAWAGKMLTTYGNDPVTLSELADLILTDPDIKDRDFKTARAAAEAADRTARNAESKALLAQVEFRSGDPKKAAELQFEAWQQVEPSAKADFKKVLDTYKKAAASAKPAVASDAASSDGTTTE
jgi:thiol-disulfide isomerase/thioredoxin